MAYLNPLELERLKLLLSGKTLTTAEQLSALDILRSRFPDFLSNPIFNLTKENLKDNNFLIKYLTNPYNRNKIKNALRNELSLSPAQQIDLEQALSEKPVVVEEVSQAPVAGEASAGQAAPAGTIAGAPPLGGMPSAPSISSPVPRRIFITEQTTPPSAGKAGGTGQGTAATNKAAGLIAKEEVPSAFQKAFENEPEHTLDPTKQPPSPSAPSGKDPSAPKFQAPRVPYSFTNATKNFGSSASIFTKKAGNRLMGGLSNILGGAGRAGGSLLGRAIGGGGRALGNLGLKAVDVGAALSHQVSRGGLSLKGPSSRVWVGALVGFFLLVFITGAISITTPEQQPTAVAGPVSSCDTSGIDILATNTVGDDILNRFIVRERASSLVKKGAEQESKFSQRAYFIRDRARDAGLNPAIFLGYWKSESHFSDYSNPKVRSGADLGCDPLNTKLTTFEESVLCAVGKSSISNSKTSQCAVSRDINSSACQAISFQQKEGVKLPISTLKDFLDSYGSKVADPNNANSDNTVKKVIADLGLASCTFAGGPGTPGSSTCPLTGNVKTTTGTKTYPEGSGGHCGLNYPTFSWCSEASLNATQTSKASFALDVSSEGKTDVATVLPKINNENIVWKLHAVLPITNIGGGLDFTGKGPSGTEYFLHLYHLAGTGNTITGFSNKPEFNSGETVSTNLYPLSTKDGGPHLHFTAAMRDTIGKWVMLEPNHDLHMCEGKGST